MATTTRTKKAPKRRQPKEKTTAKVRYGRTISVEDLRIGDEIVTMWEDDPNGYGRVVARSHEVKEIDECAGQWRTHIHVNKKDCYDIRQSVSIVVK